MSDSKNIDSKNFSISIEEIEGIIIDLDCEMENCIKIIHSSEDNS